MTLIGRPCCAVVVEKQSFSAALSLIIAGARPDRVYMTPIVLSLRVDRRVAINLTG